MNSTASTTASSAASTPSSGQTRASSPGSSPPLDILIAGAGIGGLTAAVGLRRQGHNVTVFEQSRFVQEYGAGLAIPSNSVGILLRLGIDLEAHHGAVRYSGITEHLGSDPVSNTDLHEARSRAPHAYLFVLRRDLHGALKTAATEPEHSIPRATGRPVKLVTSSKVQSVDAATGTLTLEDGSVHVGDVIIGADGVRSKVRGAIAKNKGIEPFKHRMNTFRFLVPTQTLRDDPKTAQYVDRPEFFRLFRLPGQIMIAYPGAGGETTNVACCYPAHKCPTDMLAGGVHKEANKPEMMRVYEEFGDGVQAILGHADKVGNWPLMSMDELPAWTEGKVVLVGDAAHPLLPFVAQGSSMAIEDGAALAALFKRDTERDKVEGLLKVYEKVRYQRATLVQRASKAGGEEESLEKENAELMTRLQRLAVYLQNYDAWEAAEKALRGEKAVPSIPPELQPLAKGLL